MGYVLFALVWVLNFGISVWNAYAVGKVWVEARLAGGWHRFMCWMGAVMSACGFTWCYSVGERVIPPTQAAVANAA